MLNFPGYSAPTPEPVPPADEAPGVPVWPGQPVHVTGRDFERAAYQDMAKFRRLGRIDSLAAFVTLGGDNLRLNYALIGLLFGAALMFAVWWMVTE